MKLIVGLGNPGEKYQNNRHNVGFMFVDYLVKELTSSRVNEFKFNKYLHSEIVEIPPHSCPLTPNNFPLLLAKPQTFMNKSGQAVKKLVIDYQILVDRDLIVVHDDLDIPLGKFKIQSATGPQLHNGIDSINANLKTHNYLHIRIGVDNRPPENRINGEAGRRLVPGETYVLQNFNPEEKIILQKLFPDILKRM